MIRTLPLLAFCALLAASLHPAAAAPGVRNDAPTDALLGRRLDIFDFVWAEIRQRYYDPGLNGVDWLAVRGHYRPLVAAAATEADFYALLRRMTAELRDAHTRVLTPEQARDRRADRTSSAGVILFEVEGQSVIFAVRPGSPAANAGLRPGMAVTAVDGVPIAAALARAAAEIGPSSSQRAAKVLAYLHVVAGSASLPLRLEIAVGGGSRRTVTLLREQRQPAPRFEARLLPSGALYVRFDRFEPPVARLLRATLRDHPDASGLILDLRANGGGDGREGMRAIAPLLVGSTPIARLHTRTGRAPSALLGLIRLPLELHAGGRGGQIFAGPVVVLTNEGTGSTSEVIAAALQERGRARIVGARTCGCALGVLRRRRLPDGGALAISEVGLVTGMGRRIEGEGVVPDLPVELRLADLRAGRDPVLEAGVEALRATGQ
ncbi:MAG TPA: S41 family peptidase [Allosphingosinicella sp.]|jgi:carboxyl-terminal processing protease